MTAAIEAYLAAQTEADLRAAYQAMLEWSEAPEGAEADDVDAMLNCMGLPGITASLIAVAA